MNAFTIGPLAIPIERLVGIAAIAAALVALRWLKSEERRPIEVALWFALLACVLSARVAYVLLHLGAFGGEPLRAFALWEDGYDWATGMVVGAVVALARADLSGLPVSRLLPPAFAGLMVWTLGTGLVAWTEADTQVALPGNVVLEDLSGVAIPVSRYAGSPSVVNLWATWCPPCRREMPVLAAAQERRRDVNFVFVNQGESAAAIERYVDQSGLRLRNVVADPHGAFNAIAGDVLPTTLFFDTRGRLVDRHIGALSSARLQDYLERISAKSASVDVRAPELASATGNGAKAGPGRPN